MPTQFCENCNASPKTATIWCSSCDASLCTDCSVSIHRSKALMNHATIPVNEKPKQCQKHSQPIKYWCLNDNKLLCQTCFNMDHANHPVELLNETAAQAIKKLEEQMMKVQSELNEKLEMTMRRSVSNETATKNAITQVFSRIGTIVKSREQQLINKVDAIEAKNQQAIEEHQAILRSLKEQSSEFSSKLQKMQERIDPVSILEQRRSFQRTLNHLKKRIDNCIVSQPPTHELIDAQDFETTVVNSLPLIYLKTRPPVPTLLLNTRWNSQGVTVLEGLNFPHGLAVDEDDDTVYVADCKNHRIMATTPGSYNTNGRVVAGGNGQGKALNQLNGPTNVLIDKETRSLIISDSGNHRIMRWSLEKGAKQGKIMIDNSHYCHGLAMNDDGSLYVSSILKHNVRRFTGSNLTDTIVAGRNEQGNALDQLSYPYHMAVDGEGALYVSDYWNHRIVKWSKEATQGNFEAGHGGKGEELTQLSCPRGVVVDTNGTIYAAEQGNHRVTRWKKGVTKGEVIVGGNGIGNQANQFSSPVGLSFGSQGHLFVADCLNNRVQRFSIA